MAEKADFEVPSFDQNFLDKEVWLAACRRDGNKYDINGKLFA
jgi:hypothetical protein